MRRVGAVGWSTLIVGGGLIAACTVLGQVPNLVEAPALFLLVYAAAFVCYALAIWTLRRADGGVTLAFILAVAIGCRFALLPAAPTLSTDAYRYVWDARVAHAGLDPYRHAPAADELRALRDTAIFPHLNHPTWRTLYPPAAQVFFRLVYAIAPNSIAAMKIALGLAEALALALLLAVFATLRLPWGRLAIYAWNPLVLVEIWGSAHLDAVALVAVVGATLAVARGRPTFAAFLLGVGTLLKLYPAALVPLLFTGGFRPLGVFVATVVLGYAPFASRGPEALGSLPRYLSEEYFNPGLVRSVVDAPLVTAAALLLLAGWVATRRRNFTTGAVPLIGGVIVLAPNIFPWYAVWLVPFLAVAPSAPWIAFTGTVAAAYAFFLSEPWSIPTWARILEFLPLAAAVGGAAWRGSLFATTRADADLTPL